VLIGDSITSRWPGVAEREQLSGLRVINRGAPGGSTAHMFSRFNRDVVRLHPRAVVILGGINDIAQIPLPQIEHNLTSMAETAEHHGIHIVFATLPPTGLPTEEHDPDKPSISSIPRPDDDGITMGNDEIVGHGEIQTLNKLHQEFRESKALHAR
jgi:lysophospholipase L1-like esterase